MTIAEGKHQIRLLCDAIFNDDTVCSLATKPSEAAPVEPAQEAQPVALLNCYGEGDAAVYELSGRHPAIASVPHGRHALYLHPPTPQPSQDEALRVARQTLHSIALLEQWGGGNMSAQDLISGAMAEAVAALAKIDALTAPKEPTP
jgi:hypothetical protein